MAEHINQNKEYNINFNRIKILNKEQNYWKRIIKETIKIEKYLKKSSIEKTVGKYVTHGNQETIKWNGQNNVHKLQNSKPSRNYST